MRTFSLTQNNLGVFLITEKLVELQNGKSVAKVIKTTAFTEDSAGSIATFLDHKFGTPRADVDYVLEQFEEHGHNTAEFGIYGTLVFTMFKGTLH